MVNSQFIKIGTNLFNLRGIIAIYDHIDEIVFDYGDDNRVSFKECGPVEELRKAINNIPLAANVQFAKAEPENAKANADEILIGLTANVETTKTKPAYIFDFTTTLTHKGVDLGKIETKIAVTDEGCFRCFKV